jgi:hypothetical protein
MSYLQDWIDQLDPMIAFLVMGSAFLIGGLGGWYAGEIILWLTRRNVLSRYLPPADKKPPAPGAFFRQESSLAKAIGLLVVRFGPLTAVSDTGAAHICPLARLGAATLGSAPVPVPVGLDLKGLHCTARRSPQQDHQHQKQR